jgi:hypothetical protein
MATTALVKRWHKTVPKKYTIRRPVGEMAVFFLKLQTKWWLLVKHSFYCKPHDAEKRIYYIAA